MKEIGKAFNSLFRKVGDFFDIFDLSFLVSGLFLVFSIFIWTSLIGFIIPIDFEQTPHIIVLILACYVTGLVCFVIGRWFRKIIFKVASHFLSIEEKYAFFLTLLKAHQLDKLVSFKEYLTENNFQPKRLYVKLWAKVRHNEKLEPSFSLLRRYWVMTATYDGLTTVALVWIGIMLDLTFNHPEIQFISTAFGLFLIGVIIVIVFGCSIEANRYERNQMEEIVATIASVQTV